MASKEAADGLVKILFLPIALQPWTNGEHIIETSPPEEGIPNCFIGR